MSLFKTEMSCLCLYSNKQTVGITDKLISAKIILTIVCIEAMSISSLGTIYYIIRKCLKYKPWWWWYIFHYVYYFLQLAEVKCDFRMKWLLQ